MFWNEALLHGSQTRPLSLSHLDNLIPEKRTHPPESCKKNSNKFLSGEKLFSFHGQIFQMKSQPKVQDGPQGSQKNGDEQKVRFKKNRLETQKKIEVILNRRFFSSPPHLYLPLRAETQGSVREFTHHQNQTHLQVTGLTMLPKKPGGRGWSFSGGQDTDGCPGCRKLPSLKLTASLPLKIGRGIPNRKVE